MSISAYTLAVAKSYKDCSVQKQTQKNADSYRSACLSGHEQVDEVISVLNDFSKE